MPELPEVETVKRGIGPHLERQSVTKVVIRQRQLRWPITRGFNQVLTGQVIEQVTRRGKYLLLHCETGHVIIHLGMSGKLCLVPLGTTAEKHDHIDIELNNNLALRFTDPRRFGCVLWTAQDPLHHDLLKKLGPEPLSTAFNFDYLFQQTRKRKSKIKTVIMNSNIVVGVGNIYANEALFLAGLRPGRAAGSISRSDCERLIKQIQFVLNQAIAAGGTTLRNFVSSEGKPGYFAQQLCVYGREGSACLHCQTTLKGQRLGQRQTVYCPQCQK